ncbi:MAG: outer membrane beta-barrel protein [Sulfurimonadaceae bacterium]
MKKSLALASLILVSSSAMAMDTKYFVGIGAGQGNWDVKGTFKRDSDGATGTVTVDDNGGFVSIQGGVIIEDSHKIGVAYTKYNTESDCSMDSFGIGYDYRIIINNSDWKPFVGVSYTINAYKETLTDDATTNWRDSRATLDTNIVAARLGLDYDISENFFVTASYELDVSTSGRGDPVWVTDLETGEDYTLTIEMDRMSRYGLWLSYKF